MKKNVNKVILCLTLIAIMAVSFVSSSMYNVVEAAAINNEVEVAASCNHIYSPHSERDYKDHYVNGELKYTQVTEYIYNRCVKCGYQVLVDARTHIIYP